MYRSQLVIQQHIDKKRTKDISDKRMFKLPSSFVTNVVELSVYKPPSKLSTWRHYLNGPNMFGVLILGLTDPGRQLILERQLLSLTTKWNRDKNILIILAKVFLDSMVPWESVREWN